MNASAKNTTPSRRPVKSDAGETLVSPGSAKPAPSPFTADLLQAAFIEAVENAVADHFGAGRPIHGIQNGYMVEVRPLRKA